MCTLISYVLLVLHCTVCPVSSTHNTGVLCRIEQLVTTNPHTYTRAHNKHTTLTSEHVLHLLPPNFHFRVTFNINHYLTDLPQSSLSTLFQKACMQELVLLSCIRVNSDGIQITITNNALMYEFMNNGIGIIISLKMVAISVQAMVTGSFSCCLEALL